MDDDDDDDDLQSADIVHSATACTLPFGVKKKEEVPGYTVLANIIFWEQVGLKVFPTVSFELPSLRQMGRLFHGLDAALENAPTPKC